MELLKQETTEKRKAPAEDGSGEEFEADGDLTEGQTKDFLCVSDELKKRHNICTLSDCNRKSEALEGDGRFSGDGVDTDKNHILMKAKFWDCSLFEEDMILMFFMRLLNQWKQELEEMSSEFSRTSKGKLALARFKQCSKFLSPLVKLCTTYLLPDDVKKSLVSIVESCVQRDYCTAVGHWIKMVTENAPWPTVVRKPGIRKCDDEATRKYLLSVKHLMAFCQRKYPTHS